MNYILWSMKNKKRTIAWFVLFFISLGLWENGNVVRAEDNATTYNTDSYSTKYYRTNTRTKKGIQEAEDLNTALELGVSHTLFNVCLNQLLDGNNAHVYKGKTYYFADVPKMTTEVVSQFNKNDISVTVVLLMQMDYRSSRHNLIYPGALNNQSKSYYGWNVYDQTSKETLEALMDYLASTYCRENCYVDNWIVGNEVNMPNAWNYTGTTDLATNVDIAARSFLIVNNAIKRYNGGAKAYLSLDHCWTHNDQGRGIAGKSFLDAFALRIEELAPGIDWNLAYHPYAPIMTQSNIWNSANALRYTTDDENTQFISGRNLSVLTNYVKAKYGEQVRIILSEQGFTAVGGQEMLQAAAMAYTYYAAEFDDMIDATMFRSIHDDPGETKDGFYFGLYNGSGGKRPVYDVFKYMDTEDWETYTSGCLATIGIGVWNELVTYFNGERFIPKELESITINKTGTVLAVGYKETMKYRVEPEFAQKKGIVWKSDDESIVTVDETRGELTAVAPGRAIVTVEKDGVELASCIVVVKDTEESRQNVEKFLNDLSEIVKGEKISERDLLSYRERLMGRNLYAAQVVYEIISGKEAMNPSKEYKDYVIMVYRAVMNVPEDEVPEELVEKYVACLNAGMSKKRVIADLIDTVEFDYRCYDADIDTGVFYDVIGLEDLNVVSYNIDSDLTYLVIQIAKYMYQRDLSKEELRTLCYQMFAYSWSAGDLAKELYETREFQERDISNAEFVNMMFDVFGWDKDYGISRVGLQYLLENNMTSRDAIAYMFFEIEKSAL